MNNILHFIYKLTGKHRTAEANQALGYFLAFIAGFINAGGFFIVQQYTSHMTGIVSIAADNIILGQYSLVMLMLGYIGCFVIGAAFTTMMVIKAREHALHSQYALPLSIEAMLLVFVVALHQTFGNTNFIIPLVTASLSFLMGLQNALITKISTSIIRTTHITGMTTDLGIEIARVMFNKNDTSVCKNKAFLHLSIIAVFFVGGVTGALTLTHLGGCGLLIIAFLLVAISTPLLFKDAVFYRKLLMRQKNHHLHTVL